MQAGNSADLAPPAGISPAQKEEKKPAGAEAPEQRDLFIRAQRCKLPDERKSITHKFSVGGHEGYIIVGMYEEGTPGDLHQDGEGGLHAFGFHGWGRAFNLDRSSVWCAAESFRGQADEHSL